MKKITLAVLLAVLMAPLALLNYAQTGGSTTGYVVTGWNDLGMHCMDADFTVFSLLPPYNNIHAHVVNNGKLVTSGSGLTVTYQAVNDPGGSFNSTSASKTNFWQNVQKLFGVALAPDAGLAGYNMPGRANTPQKMSFESQWGWFTATGVPITPYDNAGAKNYYPMMRVSVKNTSGTTLATTDIVLPVSDEMDCKACHSSGSGPGAKPAAGWVFDPSPERDYRLNVLRLHDDRMSASTWPGMLKQAGYNGAGLYATVVNDKTPVLCARCHPSNALPGVGLSLARPLTAELHTKHAGVIDPTNGLKLNDSSNRSACYRCHPGSTTKCLRGVMGNAVASDGTMEMQCQSCHGSMGAVGSYSRKGWYDEPSCQACHTGTAVTNSGQIRYTSVFDSTGAMRQAADLTFATTPNVPIAGSSLYRFSAGHGNLRCESCHGPTHAESASSHLNDNLQSINLQGHVGMLSECSSCHPSVPSTTNGGPHGMHPVGASWVDHHPDAVEHNGSGSCRNCHGGDYKSTVLSRSLADRTISTKYGTKVFWRGFRIGCYACHNGPSNDDQSRDTPAVVKNASASTPAGSAVNIALTATDANGDALTLRVVSQPSHGTAGMNGKMATYYPEAGFKGTDTFTFAAWDGWTDSNLGTVTVTVK